MSVEYGRNTNHTNHFRSILPCLTCQTTIIKGEGGIVANKQTESTGKIEDTLHQQLYNVSTRIAKTKTKRREGTLCAYPTSMV